MRKGIFGLVETTGRGVICVYEGKENAVTAQRLKNGETCKVTGYGQSMTPILKSGQSVICVPVKKILYFIRMI